MIVSPAGRPLQIESASAFALEAVAPAFAHLTETATAASPPTHFEIFEEGAAWAAGAFGDVGAYRLGAAGLAVVQDDPPSVESFRPAVGLEFRAGRAGLMAGDFRAHPASFALAAWLSGPRMQVMHAGAVAYDGAAVLLIGSSGAGKSTTSLACAVSGAGFLGDDLVLVEAGEEDGEAPIVHSLFATAKLNGDSARALGAEGWPRIGVTPKSKAVVAVADRLRMVRSAPIVALVFLTPPVSGRPQRQAVPPKDAMTLLMPAIAPLACRTGVPRELLALVATLARRVPAYRLPVSWAFAALEPAVRAIVEEAAEPAAAPRMGLRQ